jgi:hypothetical protein
MTREDQFRDDLADPDVEIEGIDEDGRGLYADILFSGTETQLRRVLGDTVDINGEVLPSDEGAHARVRPQW